MSGSTHADVAPTLRPPQGGVPLGMVLTANFSISAFSKRWTHCHQLANYLARFASANEGDPERYSTLLSTFFNELLEAVYRHHASKGVITIDFQRTASGILLQADVPIAAESMDFFQRAAELVSLPDPMAWYRERLERDVPDEEESMLGILELAVVYGSKLSVGMPADRSTEGTIRLEIEFPLHEVEEP